MKRGEVCATVGLAVLMLTGCAEAVAVNTPSGKAEVTVEGVSPDQVKPFLVNEMLNRKYTISHDAPYLIGFDRPTDNVLVSALVGTSYEATPNVRVSYTLVPVGHDTRVVADLAIIGNPGSAFERRHDINGGVDTPKYQIILDHIKMEAEQNGPINVPATKTQLQ